MSGWDVEQWAARVGGVLAGARYVNLGVGMPAKLPEHLSDRGILFHCENGIVGTGPAPAPDEVVPELIDASTRPVTLQTGAAIVPFDVSFSIIRGGHLDVTVLGAFQVSARGDLANWRSPGVPLSGVGGAMDLAVGAKKVCVMMHHTERDGTPKIVAELTYPVTAWECVDVVVTEYAVIDVGPSGLVVREVADGVTGEELQAMTGSPLTFGGADGALPER